MHERHVQFERERRVGCYTTFKWRLTPFNLIRLESFSFFNKYLISKKRKTSFIQINKLELVFKEANRCFLFALLSFIKILFNRIFYKQLRKMTDYLELTNAELNLDEIRDLVSSPDCGAISIFIGKN